MAGVSVVKITELGGRGGRGLGRVPVLQGSRVVCAAGKGVASGMLLK